PSVIRQTAVTALVDGHWSFGQVSAAYATQIAIDKAKKSGVSMVGVVRCNHIGRLGEYSTMASDAGVAAGKIEVARAKKAPLPPGSIVDREGRPTTDPEDYYKGGALLPFGGHKGYALSVMVEFLGRVMTGADAYAEGTRGGPVDGHSGTLILAMDP